MIHTKTKAIFIVILIILIASLGILIFGHYKIKTRILSIKEHYIASIKNSSFESLSRLEKEKQQIDEYEHIISGAFLKEVDLISFITSLESRALKNNLLISIDKVEKIEIQTLSVYKIQPIVFYLSLKGKYGDIKKFIEENIDNKQSLILKEIKIYKIQGEETYESKVILDGNILTI